MVLLSIIIAVGVYINGSNAFWETGRYLKSGNTHLIIPDNGCATAMSSKEETIFDGLENGDKIKI